MHPPGQAANVGMPEEMLMNDPKDGGAFRQGNECPR